MPSQVNRRRRAAAARRNETQLAKKLGNSVRTNNNPSGTRQHATQIAAQTPDTLRLLLAYLVSVVSYALDLLRQASRLMAASSREDVSFASWPKDVDVAREFDQYPVQELDSLQYDCDASSIEKLGSSRLKPAVPSFQRLQVEFRRQLVIVRFTCDDEQFCRSQSMPPNSVVFEWQTLPAVDIDPARCSLFVDDSGRTVVITLRHSDVGIESLRENPAASDEEDTERAVDRAARLRRNPKRCAVVDVAAPAAATGSGQLEQIESFQRLDVNEDEELVDAAEAARLEADYLNSEASTTPPMQSAPPLMDAADLENFMRFFSENAYPSAASLPYRILCDQSLLKDAVDRYRTFRVGRLGCEFSGTTGIDNIGNSCFMSCVLQALANTRELRDYFLSRLYELEANPDNPLASRRCEVLFQVAHVMSQLWSGQRSAVNPIRLKQCIGYRVEQFLGYGQQDAQEFLDSVLDSLHEDLNRVRRKKRSEEVECRGKLDMAVFRETLEQMLQWQNSFIMDLFYGFFKNTIQCLDCGTTSRKFEPFSVLALSIPVPQFRVEVFYVPHYSMADNVNRRPIRFLFNCTASSRVSSLLAVVTSHRQVDWPEARLRTLHVRGPSIRALLAPNDRIDDWIDGDRLFVYQAMLQRDDVQLRQGTHRELFVMQSLSDASVSGFAVAECDSCGNVVSCRRCTGCYVVYYCSGSCQTAAWPNHKRHCATIYRHRRIGRPFFVSFATDEVTPELVRRTCAEQAIKSIRLEWSVLMNGDDRGGGDPAGTPKTNSVCENGDGRATETNAHGGDACAAAKTVWRPGSAMDQEIAWPFDLIALAESSSLARSKENRDVLLTDDMLQARLPDGELLELRWHNGVRRRHQCDAAATGDDDAVSTSYVASVTEKRHFDHVSDSSCEHVQEIVVPAKGSTDPRQQQQQPSFPLETLISQFTQAELMRRNVDSWCCPKCKQRPESVKRLEIWCLPPVFIVQLKRFADEQRTGYGSWFGRTKRTDTVDYPLELDMSPFLRRHCSASGADSPIQQKPGPAVSTASNGELGMDDSSAAAESSQQSYLYDLFAVVNHSGQANYGHYTADCRLYDYPNTQSSLIGWRHFDDWAVSEQEAASVQSSKQAYLLFYRRRAHTAVVHIGECDGVGDECTEPMLQRRMLAWFGCDSANDTTQADGDEEVESATSSSSSSTEADIPLAGVNEESANAPVTSLEPVDAADVTITAEAEIDFVDACAHPSTPPPSPTQQSAQMLPNGEAANACNSMDVVFPGGEHGDQLTRRQLQDVAAVLCNGEQLSHDDLHNMNQAHGEQSFGVVRKCRSSQGVNSVDESRSDDSDGELALDV